MVLNISCLHTVKPLVGEKGKSSQASGGFVHLEFTQVSVINWEKEILLFAEFSDSPPPPSPVEKRLLPGGLCGKYNHLANVKQQTGQGLLGRGFEGRGALICGNSLFLLCKYFHKVYFKPPT